MTADAKLLADLKKAAKVTGASQDGFTVCIHSYDGERGYDHCFRIDKAIGAYLVALLHAHNDGTAYVPEPRWRPHTEKPTETEPVSCVIAFHDRDGDDEPFEAVLCSGIYLWRLGKFVHEDDGSKAKEPFFWTYEREITASVPAASPCESQPTKER